MKIAAGKPLQDFLAKPALHYCGALVYGVDGGLVHERIKSLIQYFLPEPVDPFAFTELSDEDIKQDTARLADECGALSLTGDRRVVYLRNAADRHTKLIEPIMPFLGASCYFIASAEELGPRSSLRLLFEQEKRLAAIACYHDEGGDLQNLVRSRLERIQISIEREALDYICARTGNDRGVTLQELDKLALYVAEEDKITLSHAELLLNDNSEASMDEIALAAADGNIRVLSHKLDALLKEGTQPIALLRIAQKYFQKLYILASAIEAGKSIDQAVADMRPPVFFKQQPIFKRQARVWGRARIAGALALLAETELACKSSSISAALLCREALTRICSKATATA